MLGNIDTSSVMEQVRGFGAGVRKECDKAVNKAAVTIKEICEFTVNGTRTLFNGTMTLFQNIVRIFDLEETEKKAAECFTKSMNYLGNGVSNIATFVAQSFKPTKKTA